MSAAIGLPRNQVRIQLHVTCSPKMQAVWRRDQIHMKNILAAIALVAVASVLAGCETTTTGQSVTKSEISVKRTTAAYPGRPYSNLITSYAKANGVPVDLAHAVVRIESNYRPNARGRAGEIGLMQLKLGTARMMGYRGSRKALYNPETNIKYGMKYLAKAQSLGGGSTCGTILKYNAGHAAKRMNPVSRRYCSKVKKFIN